MELWQRKSLHDRTAEQGKIISALKFICIKMNLFQNLMILLKSKRHMLSIFGLTTQVSLDFVVKYVYKITISNCLWYQCCQ